MGGLNTGYGLDCLGIGCHSYPSHPGGKAIVSAVERRGTRKPLCVEFPPMCFPTFVYSYDMNNDKQEERGMCWRERLF